MILALLLGVTAALFTYAMPRLPGLSCKHVDEDGRSLLMWETDHAKGRVRGRCQHCFRRTRGWTTTFGLTPAGPGPRARKATAEEIHTLQWRQTARRRTANRMRASA